MRYFAYFFYVVFFYLLVIYSRPVYISFIINTFSKINYNDDLTYSSRAASHIVLLAYAVISLLWNKKTLTTIEKSTKPMWIINWLLDFLFIPLSVLLMVIYNNTKVTMTNLSSVENMFLMWILMSIKHIIIFLRTGHIVIGRKHG